MARRQPTGSPNADCRFLILCRFAEFSRVAELPTGTQQDVTDGLYQLPLRAEVGASRERRDADLPDVSNGPFESLTPMPRHPESVR